MKKATPVNLIITNKKKQVLLVKRAENEDSFVGCWSIPGGGPQHGENYEQALAREIQEEIGCKIVRSSFFKSYFCVVDGKIAVRALYFTGRIFGKITLSKEHSEFRWVDLDKIHLFKIAYNQKQILTDFQEHIKSIERSKNNISRILAFWRPKGKYDDK